MKRLIVLLVLAGMLISAGGCASLFVSCDSIRQTYVANHPNVGQHDYTCEPINEYIPCEDYPDSPCKRESVRKRYEKTNGRILNGLITTGFTVEQVEASWCTSLRLVRSSSSRYGQRDMYDNGYYYFHFDNGALTQWTLYSPTGY